MEKIYFDTNRATIRERSHRILDEIVTVLRTHPEIAKVRVEGHTDSKGSDAHNLELSQKRADAVVGYLVEKGIDASRLEAKGYGETKPIADNGTAEGREKNRRVTFTILEGEEEAKVETEDVETK
ncbi:OmpA family protein [Persicimonas caeni]|uniref:OmpA family protein n=2 Tax=Persicimonas caeni TaxID=2292766 RepID=A0A4Y6Q437_PERCE|nr:OmpA family protein [Persicimonas caeni]QED36138.1 OmpA family protein [Persicimonas caeni]